MNRPFLHCGFIALLVSVGLLVAAQARADDEPICVVYGAPNECPSADRFRGEIALRTARAKFVTCEEAGVRTFRASIRAEQDEQYVGELVVQTTEGQPSTQSVGDPSCADVASALALIVAIAVDPRASTAPQLGANVPLVPEPKPKPKPSPGPEFTPPPAEVAPPHPAGQWGFGVTADAIVVGSVAPDAALGGAVGVEVLYDREDSLSPLVWLGGSFAHSSPLSDSTSQATMRWTVAGLRFCPLRLNLVAKLTARPCVSTSIGAVTAEGRQVAHPREATHFWAAMGPEGLVRWEFREPVFLQLAGALSAPFDRPVFVFRNPHLEVHRVPAVIWQASMGVGASF